jgi:6,7-dimethyl-8-ribityllumazine synthase
MSSSEGPERQGDEQRGWEADELERASENVLGTWPSAQLDDPPPDPDGASPLDDASELGPPADPAPDPDEERPAEDVPSDADGTEPHAETVVADPPAVEADEDAEAPDLPEATGEHAPGELAVPPGYPLLEGEARGARRAVGIVVSRFNGEVTGGLLDAALAELEQCGVEADSITVMPVPGAFELPLAAMALAKTRRFACIVALGCVIRGDTPHFDYVASEAALGLQLAAIETGVPVSFGVLTLDRPDQAAPRLEKGAEAVRTALEMADLFANLRAAAAR